MSHSSRQKPHLQDRPNQGTTSETARGVGRASAGSSRRGWSCGHRDLGSRRPWVLISYLLWIAASWFIGSAFGELMLRLTHFVTAATTVLLVLNLVTSFDCDIQTEAATT